MLSLEPDVVHAALREVRVNFEGPDAGVLGLASSVDSLLLVDSHHLERISKLIKIKLPLKCTVM